MVATNPDTPIAPPGQIVTMHVNERPVTIEPRRVTGLAIKQAAIAQGVPIEEDFILVLEREHGRTEIIGNSDIVTLTSHSRFLANDGDDDS